jgi:GNAT superfamily N-acetyltransferase
MAHKEKERPTSQFRFLNTSMYDPLSYSYRTFNPAENEIFIKPKQQWVLAKEALTKKEIEAARGLISVEVFIIENLVRNSWAFIDKMMNLKSECRLSLEKNGHFDGFFERERAIFITAAKEMDVLDDWFEAKYRKGPVKAEPEISDPDWLLWLTKPPAKIGQPLLLPHAVPVQDASMCDDSILVPSTPRQSRNQPKLHASWLKTELDDSMLGVDNQLAGTIELSGPMEDPILPTTEEEDRNPLSKFAVKVVFRRKENLIPELLDLKYEYRDLKRVLYLYRQVFTAWTDIMTGWVQQHHTLYMKNTRHVVGAMTYKYNTFRHVTFADLLVVGVNKSYQGKGYGKMMVEKLQQTDKILTWADKDSQGFYKKLGFTVMKTPRHHQCLLSFCTNSVIMSFGFDEGELTKIGLLNK